MGGLALTRGSPSLICASYNEARRFSQMDVDTQRANRDKDKDTMCIEGR